MSVGDSSSRHLVGRLLTTFGFAWLVLLFVAGSGLIGKTGFTVEVVRVGFLFPFIVLFVGRRLVRSARRGPRTGETSAPTVPRSQPRLPDPPIPDPAPTREPAPVRNPDPIVAPQASDDDLAEATGFDDAEAGSDQPVAETEIGSPHVEEQPMSSKDMIADARRRLDLDR